MFNQLALSRKLCHYAWSNTLTYWGGGNSLAHSLLLATACWLSLAMLRLAFLTARCAHAFNELNHLHVLIVVALLGHANLWRQGSLHALCGFQARVYLVRIAITTITSRWWEFYSGWLELTCDILIIWLIQSVLSWEPASLLKVARALPATCLWILFWRDATTDWVQKIVRRGVLKLGVDLRDGPKDLWTLDLVGLLDLLSTF